MGMYTTAVYDIPPDTRYPEYTCIPAVYRRRIYVIFFTPRPTSTVLNFTSTAVVQRTVQHYGTWDLPCQAARGTYDTKHQYNVDI